MKLKLILVTVVLTTFFNQSKAQGCSDAGFCTIGNLKPLAESSTKQKLTIGLTNGIGDEGVYVLTPSVQYDYRFNSNWQIQAKLTSNYASGNLGNAFGIGDLFVTGIHTLPSKNKWKSSLILGAKVPFNTSNLKDNDKSLPMQYQSSLGTLDAIAGYSITNDKWLIATAFQIPLTGKNNNNFLPVYFNTTDALKYPPSNDFNRKPDVLVRANYNLVQNKKAILNAGLLGIYHVGKDTYIDANVSNNPIEIKGSDGLTLNVTAAAQFELSKKFTLGLIAGSPLIVRDVRPDGLTRSISFSTDFIFNF